MIIHDWRLSYHQGWSVTVNLYTACTYFAAFLATGEMVMAKASAFTKTVAVLLLCLPQLYAKENASLKRLVNCENKNSLN